MLRHGPGVYQMSEEAEVEAQGPDQTTLAGSGSGGAVEAQKVKPDHAVGMMRSSSW